MRFLHDGCATPELREYVSNTTPAPQTRIFRAGTPGVCFLCYGCTTKSQLSSRSSGSTFLHYGCTTKLRLSSRSSWSTFPLLQLCYKVATFEPELREYVPFPRLVLQSCDFRAEHNLDFCCLSSSLGNGRFMRCCSPKKGGRSCSKVCKEQAREVPPKPALQNQRPPKRMTKNALSAGL